MEEPIFQRLLGRLDRVDPTAEPNGLGDNVRNRPFRDATHDQPVALILDFPEFAQPGDAVRWETGHPQAHAIGDTQDLLNRAKRKDSTVVDDRDSIADGLDLDRKSVV